ncbi:hypothetical protein [Micromonospora sp. 067-2]|uniref:hypothetical protein n=1 Tax=Micromonospora sp. 067-2 TaxID=2789270 RepID=UPI003979D564
MDPQKKLDHPRTSDSRSSHTLSVAVTIVFGLLGLVIAICASVPDWSDFLRSSEGAPRPSPQLPVTTVTGSTGTAPPSFSSRYGAPQQLSRFVVAAPSDPFCGYTRVSLDDDPEARVNQCGEKDAELMYGGYGDARGLRGADIAYFGTAGGSQPATGEDCLLAAKTHAVNGKVVAPRALRPGIGLCLQTSDGNVVWLGLKSVKPGQSDDLPTLTFAVALWRLS